MDEEEEMDAEEGEGEVSLQNNFWGNKRSLFMPHILCSE